MSLRSLGVLLLRLWGFYLLVGVVTGGVSLAVTIMHPSSGIDQSLSGFVFMSNGAALVVRALVAIGLLVGAERIVDVLQIANSGNEPRNPFSLADLQSMAFGAVGVYLAITALGEIATLVWIIARHPAWDESRSFAYVFDKEQERLVGATVRMVLAVILLIRRSAWASLWYRLRPMATPQDSEPPAG
jgi:hypothetical protein